MHTVKEYLEKRRAYGSKRAVRTKELVNIFDTTERNVKRMVATERENGALICGITKPGGYFLPASPADVIRQAKVLEQGIAKRAAVLAPFREYCRKHREGEWEGREISLFEDTGERRKAVQGPPVPDWLSKDPLSN